MPTGMPVNILDDKPGNHHIIIGDMRRWCHSWNDGVSQKPNPHRHPEDSEHLILLCKWEPSLAYRMALGANLIQPGQCFTDHLLSLYQCQNSSRSKRNSKLSQNHRSIAHAIKLFQIYIKLEKCVPFTCHREAGQIWGFHPFLGQRLEGMAWKVAWGQCMWNTVVKRQTFVWRCYIIHCKIAW